MKKISYYVAAFALCCGVSQTLTSCIEETEEPDDVKALRQAEIAKVNADAQKTLADAKASEATAAKTNAEADGQKIKNASDEVDKAIKEGSSAEAIQAAIAKYKSTIKETTNSDVAAAKTAAKAFLPDQLDQDAATAYNNYVAAKNAYLGYFKDGNWNKGTAEKLADAIIDTVQNLKAVKEKADKLNELAVEVKAKEAAYNDAVKNTAKYNKDYKDGNPVALPILAEKKFDTPTATTGWYDNSATFEKEDQTRWLAEAAIINAYLEEQANIALKDKKNEVDLVSKNLAPTGTLWIKGDGKSGVYEVYVNAKADNERAQAQYDEAKAKYDATIAALQAINQ